MDFLEFLTMLKVNIVAFQKSQAEDDDDTRVPWMDAISLLQDARSELEEQDKKMAFLLEQRELLPKHPC